MDIFEISERLQKALDPIQRQEPVAYIYHPLRYAKELTHAFFRRYGHSSPREILWLGINPGPWGMAQTGIPFGDVPSIRSFLQIDGSIEPPSHPLHPKRPVSGLLCTRRDASGQRLWGWFQDRFHTPEALFSRSFLWCVCPLLFLDAQGRNLTPDQIPRSLWAAVEPPCQDALRAIFALFQPRLILGIGRFAQTQASLVARPPTSTLGYLPHPSPQNPLSHQGWTRLADEVLQNYAVVWKDPSAQTDLLGPETQRSDLR